jgi:transposase-like protein
MKYQRSVTGYSTNVENAINDYLSSRKTAKCVCEEYGVSNSSLFYWINKKGAGHKQVTKSASRSPIVRTVLGGGGQTAKPATILPDNNIEVNVNKKSDDVTHRKTKELIEKLKNAHSNCKS